MMHWRGWGLRVILGCGPAGVSSSDTTAGPISASVGAQSRVMRGVSGTPVASRRAALRRSGSMGGAMARSPNETCRRVMLHLMVVVGSA